MTEQPSNSSGRLDVATMFGGIDIYLFDQIQKQRIVPGTNVLDAGCGTGRNLTYFLRTGYDVFGVDRDPDAIRAVRQLAARVGISSSAERFQVADVTALPFGDGVFNTVLCNAVLHFAESERSFDDTLQELWRVLASGGLFFARLASSIGIEDRVISLGGRRFKVPDGTERFLVDMPFLLERTDRLGGALLDPIKTVNVQNRRCMTNWVMRKG